MANITKTGEQKGATKAVQQAPMRVARDQAQQMRELAQDPFQLMRDLMRLDPFRQMAPLVAGAEQIWAPDFEVRETKDAYVFKADVPGAKREDIEVTIAGNRLQISGRREQEEEARGDTFFAYERAYGGFTRTFTLPDTADAEHVSTELKNGVLTLVVPKKAESQARNIPIRGEGEKH